MILTHIRYITLCTRFTYSLPALFGRGGPGRQNGDSNVEDSPPHRITVLFPICFSWRPSLNAIGLSELATNKCDFQTLGNSIMAKDARHTQSGDPDYAMRHLRFGWWSLLCFLLLGISLEVMHGYKIQWFLNVSNETRRLMWTLAHAHGIGLAVVHVFFGVMVRLQESTPPAWCRLSSPCLIAASLLLPGGFLLAGLFLHGECPGLGIYLVPVGGVLLLIAAVLIARARS